MPETILKTQGLTVTSNENDSGGIVVVKSKNYNYFPKDIKKQLVLISLESEYQKEFNKTLNEKLETMNKDNSNNMPNELKYSSAYFGTLFQLGDSPQTMFNKTAEKSLKNGDAKVTKVEDVVQVESSKIDEDFIILDSFKELVKIDISKLEDNEDFQYVNNSFYIFCLGLLKHSYRNL